MYLVLFPSTTVICRYNHNTDKHINAVLQTFIYKYIGNAPMTSLYFLALQ